MRYMIILMLLCFNLLAQEKRTEHTWTAASDAEPVRASLQDVSWLVGNWQGEAFGSRMEEVWNTPSAGSMVGMFKLYDETGVKFYELLVLQEQNDTLVMKVKHFSADFTAWEDKPDYISFPLVRLEPEAVHFRGLSFYRKGADQIDGYIVMKSGTGEIREEKLVYRRVR